MIVEDEESYRDALGFMLEREGFEVILASDGAEGLVLFVMVALPAVALLAEPGPQTDAEAKRP